MDFKMLPYGVLSIIVGLIIIIGSIIGVFAVEILELLGIRKR